MKPNREGAPMPGYLCCDLVALFKEYESRMCGHCFTDPLGVEVCFHDVNFCKLVKLEALSVQTGKYQKAKSSQVLPAMRNGAFQEVAYRWARERAQSLLWLPSVIESPDSIHANAHGVIMGDRVYVKRYAKAGSPFKLAYTTPVEGDQRVVTTSFWSPKDELERYVELPPLWPAEKQRTAVADGPSSPITPGPG
jgi:hypothetical protein